MLSTPPDLGVIQAKGIFPNDQGAAKQWFGLFMAPVAQIEFAEVVETCRHVGVIGSAGNLKYPERTVEQRFGRGVATQDIVKHRQIVEQGGGFRVIEPKVRFAQPQGLFGEFDGLLITALSEKTLIAFIGVRKGGRLGEHTPRAHHQRSQEKQDSESDGHGAPPRADVDRV